MIKKLKWQAVSHPKSNDLKPNPVPRKIKAQSKWEWVLSIKTIQADRFVRPQNNHINSSCIKLKQKWDLFNKQIINGKYNQSESTDNSSELYYPTPKIQKSCIQYFLIIQLLKKNMVLAVMILKMQVSFVIIVRMSWIGQKLMPKDSNIKKIKIQGQEHIRLTIFQKEVNRCHQHLLLEVWDHLWMKLCIKRKCPLR